MLRVFFMFLMCFVMGMETGRSFPPLFDIHLVHSFLFPFRLICEPYALN